MSDLYPMDAACQVPLFTGILQAKILEWVGCHALLQGIFPTQGSNPSLFCLLHWQEGSLPLVPPGKPRNISHRRKHFLHGSEMDSFTSKSIIYYKLVSREFLLKLFFFFQLKLFMTEWFLLTCKKLSF